MSGSQQGTHRSDGELAWEEFPVGLSGLSPQQGGQGLSRDLGLREPAQLTFRKGFLLLICDVKNFWMGRSKDRGNRLSLLDVLTPRTCGPLASCGSFSQGDLRTLCLRITWEAS